MIQGPTYRSRLELRVEDVEAHMNEFAGALQRGMGQVSNAIQLIMDTKDASSEVKSAASVVVRSYVANAQKAIAEAPAAFEKAMGILTMITEEAL